MAQVAPTDSSTIMDQISPTPSTISQPSSNFPNPDHHPHSAYPLIHNPPQVFRDPPLREPQFDPPATDNSQPESPTRDDPPLDHTQGKSPRTPDLQQPEQPQPHYSHQHLPPATPDHEPNRNALPVQQSQNGQQVMGMVPSFADMNLGPQIPYPPPPPIQMLPMQPVLPLVAPQHPVHVNPHQPYHPHHHHSAHKHPQLYLFPSTYPLWVPQERVGAVIGGHGAVIRSLQERSGATIQVHNDTVQSDHKLFTISGTHAQCDAAKRLINEIVEKPRQNHPSSHSAHVSTDRTPFSPGNEQSARSGEVWKTVYVPTSCVGLVIGRSGETIRNLQDRTGADIKVTPDEEANPESDTRSILISGTEEAISSAHQLISEIVEARTRRPPHAGSQMGGGVNGQPFVVETLTIPNGKVGLIIGKRGAAIRELQRRSGAKIQVTKDDSAIQSDGSRPVTITGIRSQVDEAKGMIASKINIPLVPSAAVSPIFNSPQPATGNVQPVAGPGQQMPYLVSNVYDPAFQNGQQPFQQMYDPNDPSAQNRAMTYFPFIGYNNYAVAQQRQYQSQIPLHYPHPSQQVQQEQPQQSLQTTHQEPQGSVGQPQYTSPTLQRTQVESVQGSPRVLPRDANGNVMMYASHYPQLAPHPGAHQMYNSGHPNTGIYSRREQVQAAHHARMMMQAQALAHAQHAQAIHAQQQVQGQTHADVEADTEVQPRQQQTHAPTIQTEADEEEKPNG